MKSFSAGEKERRGLSLAEQMRRQGGEEKLRTSALSISTVLGRMSFFNQHLPDICINHIQHSTLPNQSILSHGS